MVQNAIPYELWFCFVSFGYNYRYVAQGKCLLQPHHLIDGLESVIGEDKGKQILSDGPFSEVLRSAQVRFLLLSGLILLVLCFDDLYEKKQICTSVLK